MDEPEVTCELDECLKNLADIIKGESFEIQEGKENLSKWISYLGYCILEQDASFISEVDENG